MPKTGFWLLAVSVLVGACVQQAPAPPPETRAPAPSPRGAETPPRDPPGYGPVTDPTAGETAGAGDRTTIRREGFEEAGENYLFTIRITARDGNFEGDGDGGKIEFINSRVIGVVEEDWEGNCAASRDFSYECHRLTDGNRTFQWFNFVFGDEDRLKLVVQAPRNQSAFIRVVETGGMECGAYFQTAQSGPYRGYPDGSGGPPCSAPKTFLGPRRISELGGFPVTAPLVRAAP